MKIRNTTQTSLRCYKHLTKKTKTWKLLTSSKHGKLCPVSNGLFTRSDLPFCLQLGSQPEHTWITQHFLTECQFLVHTFSRMGESSQTTFVLAWFPPQYVLCGVRNIVGHPVLHLSPTLRYPSSPAPQLSFPSTLPCQQPVGSGAVFCTS